MWTRNYLWAALVCYGVAAAVQDEPSATEFPDFITDAEFAAAEPISIENPNGSMIIPTSDYNNSFPSNGKFRAGFGNNPWTNAEVPYVLDPNFNAQQRNDVARAIQHYHDNTCIRFVPKQNHHRNYINILYDSNVCGVASLCMTSGGYAKFGGSCANWGVMVHELGHTMCMGHEQTRQDRDKWISWDTSKCSPHNKDNLSRGLHKLYDYVSVEHYEGECYNGCIIPNVPGVTKCGSGGPLSVLDIELLNEMYNCGGCNGYRYTNSLSTLTYAVVVDRDRNGDALLSCRAYHQGDILPGKFVRNACYVPWNGGEHKKMGENIEVLTNPNSANLRWVKSSSLPGNAIRGGRTRERETLYVVRCRLTFDGQTLWTPGKYHNGAYSTYGGREHRCSDFEFLVCS